MTASVHLQVPCTRKKVIYLRSRLIACCKLVPTLARQMWRHNYVIDRNEYLIFTLSESINPWVYSLQLLFKSTNNSWRSERNVSGCFFSEHSVLSLMCTHITVLQWRARVSWNPYAIVCFSASAISDSSTRRQSCPRVHFSDPTRSDPRVNPTRGLLCSTCTKSVLFASLQSVAAWMAAFEISFPAKIDFKGEIVKVPVTVMQLSCVYVRSI